MSQRCAFYRPPDDSPEMRYLQQRRAALGGFLPARRRERRRRWPVPPLASYAQFALDADGKEMSTTMAVVRMLGSLLRDQDARPAHRADRRRRGAHLRHGEPVPADRHLLAASASSTSRRMPARCSPTGKRSDGQLLEEGITEAGAMSSWIAGGDRLQRARPRDAAVLHLLLDVRLSARRRPDLGRGRSARARLPARRDRRPHHARRARGCSTRTAASHVMAATVPNCRAYDPGVRLRTRGDRRPRHAPHDRSSRSTSSTTSP